MQIARKIGNKYLALPRLLASIEPSNTAENARAIPIGTLTK
jgi:hypothetical protein